MGTMGSGKTTVTRLLSKSLHIHMLEEHFGDNAFLPRFYDDMKRWAFHSQTFFLMEKISQILDAKQLLAKTSVIQDTPIEQDVFSYAKAQHVLGNMDDAEWKLYQKIFHSFESQFPPLSLLVYLETSLPVIEKRITNRGRGFEKEIPLSYITLLDTLNKDWLKERDIPVVTINTDTLDIIRSTSAQTTLVTTVKAAMKSL